MYKQTTTKPRQEVGQWDCCGLGALQIKRLAGEIHLCLDHRIKVAPVRLPFCGWLKVEPPKK